MAMLEGVAELPLERLNTITQAGVEQDYHRNLHAEIATTPLKRYLDAANVGCPCPGNEKVRDDLRPRSTAISSCSSFFLIRGPSEKPRCVR